MISDRHLVHFYEHNTGFADLVTAWLVEGLRAREPCVLIATPQHRALLEARLSQRVLLGNDVKYLPDCYHAYDAAATLAQFTEAGWPDAERFGEVMGSILRTAARGTHQPVRAFGEMVSLLITSATPQAAVALEKLWNRLLEKERFTLLCSYPRSSFVAAQQRAQLGAICAEHKGVCLP